MTSDGRIVSGVDKRRHWATPTDDEVKQADLHASGLWEEVANTSRRHRDNMQTPSKTKRIQIMVKMQCTCGHLSVEELPPGVRSF